MKVRRRSCASVNENSELSVEKPYNRGVRRRTRSTKHYSTDDQFMKGETETFQIAELQSRLKIQQDASRNRSSEALAKINMLEEELNVKSLKIEKLLKDALQKEREFQLIEQDVIELRCNALAIIENNTSMSNENSVMKQQVNTMANEYRQIVHKVKDFTVKVAENEQLVQEIKNLRLQVIKIEHENCSFKNQLTIKSKKVKLLAQKVRNLGVSVTAFKRENSVLRSKKMSKIAQLQVSKRALQMESRKHFSFKCQVNKESHKVEVVSKQNVQKVNDLTQCICELQDKNVSLTNQLTMRTDECHSVMKEVAQVMSQTENENSVLKGQLIEKENDYQRIVQVVSELKQQIAEIDLQNTSLIDQLTIMTDKCCVLLQKVEKNKQLMSQAQDENSLLKSQLRTKTMEYEHFFQHVKDLKQPILDMEKKNDSLSKMLIMKAQEYSKMMLQAAHRVNDNAANNSSLQHQLDMKESEYQQVVQEVNDLNRKMSEIEQNNASLNNTLSMKVDECKMMMLEAENCKQEISSLKYQLGQSVKESEYQQVVQEVNDLKLYISDIENKNTFLSNRLMMKTDECDWITQEARDCNHLLNQTEDENNILKYQLIMKTNNNMQIVEELKDLQKHITDIEEKNSVMESQFTMKMAAYQQVMQEIKDLRLQATQSECQNSSLKNQITMKSEQLGSMIKTVSDLRLNATESEKMNSALRSLVTIKSAKLQVSKRALQMESRKCFSIKRRVAKKSKQMKAVIQLQKKRAESIAALVVGTKMILNDYRLLNTSQLQFFKDASTKIIDLDLRLKQKTVSGDKCKQANVELRKRLSCIEDKLEVATKERDQGKKLRMFVMKWLTKLEAQKRSLQAQISPLRHVIRDAGIFIQKLKHKTSVEITKVNRLKKISPKSQLATVSPILLHPTVTPPVASTATKNDMMLAVAQNNLRYNNKKFAIIRRPTNTISGPRPSVVLTLGLETMMPRLMKKSQLSDADTSSRNEQDKGCSSREMFQQKAMQQFPVAAYVSMPSLDPAIVLDSINKMSPETSLLFDDDRDELMEDCSGQCDAVIVEKTFHHGRALETMPQSLTSSMLNEDILNRTHRCEDYGIEHRIDFQEEMISEMSKVAEFNGMKLMEAVRSMFVQELLPLPTSSKSNKNHASECIDDMEGDLPKQKTSETDLNIPNNSKFHCPLKSKDASDFLNLAASSNPTVAKTETVIAKKICRLNRKFISILRRYANTIPVAGKSPMFAALEWETLAPTSSKKSSLPFDDDMSLDNGIFRNELNEEYSSLCEKDTPEEVIQQKVVQHFEAHAPKEVIQQKLLHHFEPDAPEEFFQQRLLQQFELDTSEEVIQQKEIQPFPIAALDMIPPMFTSNLLHTDMDLTDRDEDSTIDCEPGFQEETISTVPEVMAPDGQQAGDVRRKPLELEPHFDHSYCNVHGRKIHDSAPSADHLCNDPPETVWRCCPSNPMQQFYFPNMPSTSSEKQPFYFLIRSHLACRRK